MHTLLSNYQRNASVWQHALLIHAQSSQNLQQCSLVNWWHRHLFSSGASLHFPEKLTPRVNIPAFSGHHLAQRWPYTCLQTYLLLFLSVTSIESMFQLNFNSSQSNFSNAMNFCFKAQMVFCLKFFCYQMTFPLSLPPFITVVARLLSEIQTS